LAKFSAIIKISKENENTALNSIKNQYSKSISTQFGKKGDTSLYQVKTGTSDTKEIVETNLNGITGVSVVSVESEPGSLSHIPKKFSTWLMIGLIVSWLIFSFIAFTDENNFINALTPSQLLVIQITIAVVISIWIFLYDKKTQHDVVDVLAKLDLRTSEINENVKDLDLRTSEINENVKDLDDN